MILSDDHSQTYSSFFACSMTPRPTVFGRNKKA